MWITSVNWSGSMVSGPNIIGGVPISSSSSSASAGAAADSPATSSHYLNILSSSAQDDLTKATPCLTDCPNTEFSSERNVNLSDIQMPPWNSYDAPLRSPPRRLIHQEAVHDATVHRDSSKDLPEDKSIQLNFDNQVIKYNALPTVQRPGAKVSNTDRAATAGRILNRDLPTRSLRRHRSWWKKRFSFGSSGGVVRSHSNIFPSSLRSTKLWNSISKPRNASERNRKEERPKVPRLQIWLSADPREEEGPQVAPFQPVLNNTREIPRIHLEHPSASHRSGFDATRFRALSEGAYITADAHLSSQGDAGTSVKSPVEKQPTWPVYYQPSRPRLIHQNCLKQVGKWSEDGEAGQRRLELPRQNAIAEDDWSTSQHKKQTPDAELKRKLSRKETLGARKSTASVKSGRISALGSNFLRAVRNVTSSRSYSDDRSDNSEETSEAENAGGFQSVFSLADPSSTPCPSWASSRTSVYRSSSFSEDRPDSLNLDYLSARSAHPPCSRSNSTSSTLLGYEWPQLRLNIPGGEERSRRPSLLSINRSPIPYISMDYDSDYENFYSAYHGLCPEDAPKLSFTQKLAFPTLYQNSIDRPKPRDPFTESENNMNTIAKFITFVILTFVAVVIVAGIFKLFK